MDFELRPIAKKWFSEATPINYKVAKATITADDETINVLSDD